MHPEGFGATFEDVDARVIEDFDPSQYDGAWKMLRRLEEPNPVPEYRRVQYGALKIADGDWRKLADLIELGLLDYRDVLQAAYY